MPYIKTTTSISIPNKEKLKAALGKIISLIPGKSEDWLMLSFEENKDLYFKGKKTEKAAFVEVKIFGSCSKESKNKVVKEICSLLNTELNIKGDSVYITFQEISDWGYDGALF